MRRRVGNGSRSHEAFVDFRMIVRTSLVVVSDVSKGDCIIMGDFNHGNIKWNTLQSTGVEDQKLLCLVQDNFSTQHVLEPTRATRVLDIVLSSQKELVDNV